MVMITLFKFLSAALLEVRPPKLTSSRNKIAQVYYRSTNSDLLLQTPELQYVFAPDANNCVKLGLQGYDKNGSDQAQFSAKIAEAESRLLACINEQASLWPAAIPVEFKSVLYQGKLAYAPTIKLKVATKLSVYDQNRKQIKLDDVERNSVVKAIVRLAYVWMTNGHFGATWQLTQLMVVSGPRETQETGFAFVDES